MFFFKPPKDQKPLVKREFYLARLGKEIKHGKNVALLGSRKTGKTWILSDLTEVMIKGKEELPVYIDLNRISTPPENFSIELVGSVGFWFMGPSSLKDYKNYLKLDYLLKNRESFGKGAAMHIEALHTEIQKIKPDQRFMIESAFSFIEEISKKSKKRVVLCIDNFERILDLNNFSQIKDILSLINFDSPNISYAIASSAVTLFKKSLKEFGFQEIKGFTKEETREAVKQVIGKADNKLADEIFGYSEGVPYLVNGLCKKYVELGDVKKAFISELISSTGCFYRYAEENFNDSMNRARGKSLLVSIIKTLSSMKEARLTEIASRIYRAAPVTKSLLERLVSVDLVVKKENMYTISDSVLKKWIKLVFSGYDSVTLTDEVLKTVQEELDKDE